MSSPARITLLVFTGLAVAVCAWLVGGHRLTPTPAAAATVSPCGTTGDETTATPASTPTPATTSTPGSTTTPPSTTTPGVTSACWVDVTPYPFGADGGPVDTSSAQCRPPQPTGPSYAGDQQSCYLKVDSMAFRAWNRGLAATSPVVGDLSASTAFGVWLYNGTRWFPDPTFPGQAVCKGSRVLWAGRRDYWLVGGRVKNWPSLCRFDGVNFEWQPLDVPKGALDRVPLDVAGKRKPGAINAGACASWDNCWFFGSYGIVLHWDGNVLTDATPDVNAQPWLGGEYTAAVARPDAVGGPIALATGATAKAVTAIGSSVKGDQLPARADGAPPPQLFRSSGGPFSALALAPPAIAQPNDPYRTDLVAVDADAQGNVWLAGDPVGYRVSPTTLGNPGPDDRRVTTAEPAPLLAARADGQPRPCAATPPDRFQYANVHGTDDGLLWSSVAAVPGGDGLAAGQLWPGRAGTTPNDDGTREPVIVEVFCDRSPVITRFRVPDPTWDPSRGPAPLVPADRTGAVTAIAASAVNDGWASTTSGSLVSPVDAGATVPQRPRLYHLTDVAPPAASPGDDNESRPVFFAPDPPIYIELPPDPEPAPEPDRTVTAVAAPVRQRVKLKAAIYQIKTRVVEDRKHRLTLNVTFRVRRAVTIGIQGLRRNRVVTTSGLKHFKGPRGTLILRLDRRHWPTRIRFVTPKAK